MFQLCNKLLIGLIDDWRFDGHRFKQVGKTAEPKKKPQIIKRHYFSNGGTCKLFRKYVYTVGDPNTADVVAVHYIGDASSSLTYPHGKCTIPCLSNNSGFLRRNCFNVNSR